MIHFSNQCPSFSFVLHDVILRSSRFDNLDKHARHFACGSMCVCKPERWIKGHHVCVVFRDQSEACTTTASSATTSAPLVRQYVTNKIWWISLPLALRRTLSVNVLPCDGNMTDDELRPNSLDDFVIPLGFALMPATQVSMSPTCDRGGEWRHAAFAGDSSYCCGIRPAGEQREADQQQTVPGQFRQFLWSSNRHECWRNWEILN